MKKKWRSKSDYFNSDLPMLSMSILEEYVHGITQSMFCKNKMHGGIAQIEIWSIWKKYIGLGTWQKLIIHQKSILKQKRFNSTYHIFKMNNFGKSIHPNVNWFSEHFCWQLMSNLDRIFWSIFSNVEIHFESN